MELYAVKQNRTVVEPRNYAALSFGLTATRFQDLK